MPAGSKLTSIWIAAAIALAAAAGWLWRVVRAGEASAAADPPEAETLLQRIDEQRRALSDLDERVRELEGQLSARTAEPFRLPDVDLADVLRAFADPEASDELTPERLRELQARALDASQPAEQRLNAARVLHNVEARAAGSALTSEIVDAQLTLLLTLPGAALRRQACVNVTGHVQPRHGEALVGILTGDADETVRSQAALALGDLTDQVAVRRALERAGESDPSDAVRSAAADALTRWVPAK